MRYQALAVVLLSFRGVYCAGSAEPIYGKGDAIADSTIVGRWRGVTDTITDDSVVIEREPAGSDSSAAYRLAVYGADGVERDDLHLTRIGGLLLADVYPTKHGDPWNMIPIHGILFARQQRNRLTVHVIDGEWLQRYSAMHPKEIKIDSIGGFAVFTDSTARVRAFLAKQVNAGLWMQDSMVFVRMPVPGTR